MNFSPIQGRGGAHSGVLVSLRTRTGETNGGVSPSEHGAVGGEAGLGSAPAHSKKEGRLDRLFPPPTALRSMDGRPPCHSHRDTPLIPALGRTVYTHLLSFLYPLRIRLFPDREFRSSTLILDKSHLGNGWRLTSSRA